jgi:hypothetical protein
MKNGIQQKGRDYYDQKPMNQRKLDSSATCHLMNRLSVFYSSFVILGSSHGPRRIRENEENRIVTPLRRFLPGVRRRFSPRLNLIA